MSKAAAASTMASAVASAAAAAAGATSSSPRYLVTGAGGFVGVHVVRHLLRNNVEPWQILLCDVNSPLRSQTFRQWKQTNVEQRVAPSIAEQRAWADDALLGNDGPSKNTTAYSGELLLRAFRDRLRLGSLDNDQYVQECFTELRPTHVIHLAGLQIPTCRTQPVIGGAVNVLGTLNILNEAKVRSEELGEHVPVVFASSAAVAGKREDYGSTGVLRDDQPHLPRTHYGVFKQANEGNARVFWQDNQLPSIGLRPHTVFGLGREIGVTSGPTKAIKAAILGRPYQLQFRDTTSFNFVEDVASVFVKAVDTIKSKPQHASLNMAGELLDIEKEFLPILAEELPQSRELITVAKSASQLPLEVRFKQPGLDKLLPDQKYTSVREGVRQTIAAMTALHAKGKLHDADLD